MAAKRAMQVIIHATGMKYDCPIVIMPIKSRKPVNLLALVCRNSIFFLTMYALTALLVFTSAISPIIIHNAVGSFSHGNNLYPTAKTNTKSAKLSNLAPNLLSTPHRLARKPSSISVVPPITKSTQKGTVIASTKSNGRHNAILVADRIFGICFIVF